MADEVETPEASTPETGGAGFWIAVVIGGAIGGYGLLGLLQAAPATRPPQALLGALGLDLLHDAVLAPIACVVGYVIVRRLPALVRRPVRAGLFATFVVLVVGWAPLRGYGRARVPDNPTVGPLDYPTAIATVLVVVWLLVAAWVACAWLRRRASV
jgi:hypothetical protein